MKWKRSKKAAQEAKAKAKNRSQQQQQQQRDDASKSGTKLDSSHEEDEDIADYSSDQEEEMIEVGEEGESAAAMGQPPTHQTPFPLPLHLPGLPPSAQAPLNLVTPPGLVVPAPLSLVGSGKEGSPSANGGGTSLGGLLPAHLAKLGPNNRLYRPFVA